MKALRVPHHLVEDIRNELIEAGALDNRRRIIDLGEVVEIPITCPVDSSYPVVDQAAPDYYQRQSSLRDILGGRLSDDALGLLPSGWQFLGDAILVRLHPCLDPHRFEVARALLEMHPRCHRVFLDREVRGRYREPDVELLMGEGTEVLHRENGCVFKLDVARIMWSKGNLHERTRMAHLGGGARVVDMFAGIGYFTIPMAVHSHPEMVIPIEWNPLAYKYLVDNISLNHVEDRVSPLHGDCAEMAPKGWADRVIMGLVGTGDMHRYLSVAIEALKPEGGVIHYHETVPEHLLMSRPLRRVEEAATALGRRCKVLGVLRIKKYAPGVRHVVVDIQLD